MGAIRKMVDSGVDVLLEVGPGATLTVLGQLCVTATDILWLNSQIPNHEWETLLYSVARLYARGTDIDWKGYDAPYRRHSVPLPVYQYDIKNFRPKASIPDGVVDGVKGLSNQDRGNFFPDTASEQNSRNEIKP